MTIIEAMTADLRDGGTIMGLSRWTKGGHERTYIRAAGYSEGYRGCRTHQLYWDHATHQLVNRRGPGMTPSTYDDAVERIIDAFVVTD